MSLAIELTLRVVISVVIGAVIGYERELRAKGAGIRTHVLVALGSCLFMIISQYGFPEAVKFDAARIAAGVVGGLGFLGGGIIMKTKNHVTGLTTAAGLWVTGAIGLAAGSGMYELSLLCTLLVIVVLEALNYYTVRLGDKEVNIVLSAKDQKSLTDAVKGMGRSVKDFALFKQPDGSYKGTIVLHIPKREYRTDLLTRMSSIPGVELESME